MHELYILQICTFQPQFSHHPNIHRTYLHVLYGKHLSEMLFVLSYTIHTLLSLKSLLFSTYPTFITASGGGGSSVTPATHPPLCILCIHYLSPLSTSVTSFHSHALPYNLTTLWCSASLHTLYPLPVFFTQRHPTPLTPLPPHLLLSARDSSSSCCK